MKLLIIKRRNHQCVTKWLNSVTIIRIVEIERSKSVALNNSVNYFRKQIRFVNPFHKNIINYIYFRFHQNLNNVITYRVDRFVFNVVGYVKDSHRWMKERRWNENIRVFWPNKISQKWAYEQKSDTKIKCAFLIFDGFHQLRYWIDQSCQ